MALIHVFICMFISLLIKESFDLETIILLLGKPIWHTVRMHVCLYYTQTISIERLHG